MTLKELIDALEELSATLPEEGETEIKVAFQPNYPLSARISCLSVVGGPEEGGDCTIYIGAGGAEDYAPRSAFNPEENQFHPGYEF